jgi:6-phosphogluconolactonase
MTSQPSIQIFADLAGLSQAAAQLFAGAAHAAVAERGIFIGCLSGGSTPQGLFRLLAQAPYTPGLPWERMVFFWGDERLVPPDDPQSNYGQTFSVLFSRVPVPPANLCRTKGELPAAQAAADTAAQLGAQARPGEPWPRFDLALLGLGADGHTASLFPGSDPAAGAGQAALAVTGDYQGRPAQRVTLTPAVFNASRQVVFLAAGADKAAALAATLQGPPDPRRWPAQRIAPADGQVTWLVDAAAAEMLNKKD